MKLKTTNINPSDYEVGVIICRMQIHELHDAHLDIINYVRDKHDDVIIFLGVSPTVCNQKNPLDFITRKLMLEQSFSNITILPLLDCKSDSVWSNKIDEKIKEVYPTKLAILYGGRDSFIPHYCGKNKTCELEPSVYVSATDIRKTISKKTLSSPDFRAGVIYGTYNSFPTVYSTVDVAILNDKGEILLAQKPNETGYRFIGGFVDMSDESDMMAAKREAMEETGLELADFQFVCSRKIADWRYAGMKDRSIMTRFYKCKYTFGAPQPNDDICVLKWFKLDNNLKDILVGEHQKLFDELLLNI